jgi:PAP2 superfamily
VPVLVTAARRRLWLVLEIGLILVGANLTTEVLKQVLAHPRAESLLGGVHPLPSTSWPSGHTTAAMSLAVCCVLAAPSRLRPFVAAGGATFVAAVAYSLLALNTHYPSDVLCGFLVAGTWTLLGAAAVRLAGVRRSRSDSPEAPARPAIRQALGPLFAALVIAIVLAGVLALARPRELVSYAHLREGFVIGAAAIGAAGLAVAAAMVLALRSR